MSDLLIKGMKMPKNCCECWFMEGADEWCCAHRGRYLEPDYRYGIKDKPDWCPLVEVPPHGRLADIVAVISVLEEMSKEYPPDSIGRYWISIFSDILKAASTVIPASEEGET